MTVKELYEMAVVAGAEDYDLEVWLQTGSAVVVSQPKLDYIAHGERVIVLTNKHR